MEKLTDVIATNITSLRKNAGLTQVQFAEKLNYSNKTVSKWERGEAAPDIETLKEIADLFQVDVDYFLHTHEEVSQAIKEELEKKEKEQKNNRIILCSLGICFIFMLVTIIFVYMIIFAKENTNPWRYAWIPFLWAVPTSCMLLGVMSKKWMPKKQKIALYSVFTWSLITAIVVQCIISYAKEFSFAMIYMLGIPIQVAIILYGRLK